VEIKYLAEKYGEQLYNPEKLLEINADWFDTQQLVLVGMRQLLGF
jgi:hypothetical protein